LSRFITELWQTQDEKGLKRMKISLAVLVLLGLAAATGAAQAGLIGDILNPLFPPRSTPELEPSVLTGMAAAGMAGYPLASSVLKRWIRRDK
jgi:hypothetical protein